jgi:hypothetical protein
MAEERRQSDNAWRAAMLLRLGAQDTRLNTLTARVVHIEGEVINIVGGLRANTTLTQQIADDTSALREIQNDAAAAIRFFCRMAKWWRFFLRYVVLPIGGLIAIPYLIVYWFAHDYTLPLWVTKLLEIWK